MNKKKIIARVVILLSLCFALTFALASCGGGGNIVIDTSLDFSGLNNVETEGAGSEIEGTEGEVEGSGSETVTDGTGNGTETESGETGESEKQEKVEVNLEESTNVLDKLLSWIGIALRFTAKIMPFNNYILTLCVFAIVMEIVFLPFGIKQHKNSLKQAKLKPKEMAIRRKYAGRNDQATMQKLNQEIQELYQQENYNPLSGCLPLLIQFPVLIVLYWVVVNPMKYVLGCSDEFIRVMHAIVRAENPGIKLASNGSIQLLNKVIDMAENGQLGVDVLGKYVTNPVAVAEKIDFIVKNPLKFNIGSLNLGNIPQFKFWTFGSDVHQWLLLLIPVLTFVVYFFSMRLNRKFSFQPTQSADEKQQACSNTMMDVTMPLMSVYIAFIVPAAIGVYWMFKSMLGVLKQFILSKVMPFPKFTEEDFKAAEKEMAGKQPKKIQKSENAGKVRSLHHIDDEDYDDQGNYKPVKEEKTEAEKSESANSSAMSDGVSLKDESDSDKKFSFRDLFKKNGKDDK